MEQKEFLDKLQIQWDAEALKQSWDKNDIVLYGLWLQEQFRTLTQEKVILKECLWQQDYDGNWDTACGDKHILIEGTPKENHFEFCCYCGKTIAENKYGHTYPKS
jgi:hypothetical protein